MLEFRYEAPETIEDAVALLADQGENARIFAGGTDVIVQMKEELIEPATLIDIKRVANTREIKIDEDQVTIGACVTGAELGENEELKELLPGVVEAVQLIGSDQVQGRATVGGNLCNASPAADSVPALIAAGAKALIAGPNGTREIAVEDFLTGPGQKDLNLGEFVVSLIFPTPRGKSQDAYLRFIPRTEMDIAVVGAGIAVSLNDDGTCASVRLALGAVAPTARLVPEAPDIMVGELLDDDVLADLAAASSRACQPINDKRGTIEFRTHVAGVLACRAAKIAWHRAENM